MTNFPLPATPSDILPSEWGSISSPLPHSHPNKLSVVMIVKDEIANIRDALDNFLNFADEIIVNDTGSTDGTLNVLKEYWEGGKIHYCENKWRDDFSIARNQAIEKAQCGWIMWLDADDRVPQTEYKNIRMLKQAPLDRVFMFRVINCKDGLPIGANFMQSRMFPSHDNIRFERRIHEQIAYSCKRMGLKLKRVNIDIHHHGYSDDNVMRKKVERNLKLMEGLDRDAALTMSYCNGLIGLERYDEAVLELLKLWDGIDEVEYHDIHFSLPGHIGVCYLYKRDFDKAIEWFGKADSRDIEAQYHCGVAHMERFRCEKDKQDIAEAMQAFYNALKCEEITLTTAIEHNYARIHSFHQLMRLLIATKHFPQAVRVAQMAAEAYPEVELC